MKKYRFGRGTHLSLIISMFRMSNGISIKKRSRLFDKRFKAVTKIRNKNNDCRANDEEKYNISNDRKDKTGIQY